MEDNNIQIFQGDKLNELLNAEKRKKYLKELYDEYASNNEILKLIHYYSENFYKNKKSSILGY